MFYDNLAQACKDNNLKIATVVKECGGAVGSIDGWKKGAIPRSDIVAKLALRLNVSTDFLILGKDHNLSLSKQEAELLNYFTYLSDEDRGRILGKAETLAELAAEQKAKEQEAEQAQRTIEISSLAADGQPDPNEQEPEEDDGYYIDFYDFPASAGTGLLIDETVAEKLMIKASPEALSADYAIPISGDSMEPSFSSEDIVLIKSCQKISEGQIGIFVLDGDVYIKEYGGNCLISHNSDYSPIMLKGYRTAVCLGWVLGKAEIIE